MTDVSAETTASTNETALNKHAFPEGVRSLSGLSKWLRIGLAVFAVSSVVMTIFNAVIWMMPQTVSDQAFQDGMPTAFLLSFGSLAVIVAYFASFLLCVVLTCRFTVRAMKNLYTVGEKTMEKSPGWTVGSYFVPFANLIVPYMGMEEAYDGSRLAAGHNPHADFVLPGWWGLWIFGNMVGNVSNFIGNNPIANTLIGGASLLMLAGAAVLMRVAVGRISDAQTEIELGGKSGVFA